MPNVNVFRGSDATLVLAVDDKSTEEGKAADGLITQYELSSILGRLQQVQVKVENEIQPYHEIGKRFPTELRPGQYQCVGIRPACAHQWRTAAAASRSRRHQPSAE